MSKTYRKASFTDNQRGGAKKAKRTANKKVRKFKGDLPEGYSFLKKIFDPWNIHDYRFTLFSKKEVLEDEWCRKPAKMRSTDLYKEKGFSRDTIRNHAI